MTSESMQIVAVVDRFPEDIRERFLNSVHSLAEIYRTAWPEPLPRQRETPKLPDNVVPLRRGA